MGRGGAKVPDGLLSEYDFATSLLAVGGDFHLRRAPPRLREGSLRCGWLIAPLHHVALTSTNTELVGLVEGHAALLAKESEEDEPG